MAVNCPTCDAEWPNESHITATIDGVAVVLNEDDVGMPTYSCPNCRGA